jgi:nucleoid DNA-binding protein
MSKFDKKGGPGSYDALVRQLAIAWRQEMTVTDRQVRTFMSIVKRRCDAGLPVHIPGFGTFRLSFRKPVTVDAPPGAEGKYRIPPTSRLAFRASKSIVEELTDER